MHMRAVQSGSETLVTGNQGNTVKTGSIAPTHEQIAANVGMPQSEIIWLFIHR